MFIQHHDNTAGVDGAHVWFQSGRSLRILGISVNVAPTISRIQFFIHHDNDAALNGNHTYIWLLQPIQTPRSRISITSGAPPAIVRRASRNRHRSRSRTVT